jgi:hypothetical protein
MSFLDFLSPAARAELEALIEQKIAEALRRHRPTRRFASVREAADVLGLTEKAIRGRIERGHIGVQRHGRSLLVDLDSIDGDGR